MRLLTWGVAALVAASGCIVRPMSERLGPNTFDPADATVIIRTAEELGCSSRVVVYDVADGRPFPIVEPTGANDSPAPRRSLRDAHDEYVARRSGKRGVVPPVPPPLEGPEPPVDRRMPLGPRRVGIAEEPLRVTGGAVVPAGNAAAIAAGAVALLWVFDRATAPDPIAIDVDPAPGKLHLLHCDAARDPWAWITVEEGTAQ